MNNIVLIGRLAADPKIRYTKDQTAVASFNVAIDRIGKDKGADFPRVTVFGKQAGNGVTVQVVEAIGKKLN